MAAASLVAGNFKDAALTAAAAAAAAAAALGTAAIVRQARKKNKA